VQTLQTNADEARRLVDWLDQEDVTLIGLSDPRYPERLSRLLGVKAPPLLAARGNLSLLDAKSVGFCGSRKASPKGIDTAADCAAQLAQAGLNVASGYAPGVDLATHRAALGAGGTTTVVLAEGILNFRLKRALEDSWGWQSVVVVSEFMPLAKWSVGNAMQRNATICALSSAMVLIESKLDGGSIDAGRTSLRLGIPLFAPLYDGMPECANGNARMLQEGALPLRKNRHTGLANMEPVLEAVSRARVDSLAPYEEASRQPALLG